MKINDINRVGSVNPYRKHMAAGQTDSVGKKKQQDAVQFSEEALKLLEAQGQTAVDPARAAKLAELKDAVSTGTYNVDADKIADKLLSYFNNKN